ncbi:MAG: sulfatase-like hydrolase/transferase, partial [Candidatus Solibacter sp.]|nr:sulfatase-like hydrolase/transferase [Candidatus Solibacter sp.]
HSPMQVADGFFEKFAHLEPKLRARDPQQEEVPMTRAALAMCENLDWNVGRVLTRLEELKLADNTIVVYFSDNGPASWRWNGGMKGRKGSVDEGGLRVPFLMRWPGHIRPGARIPQIAGAIDLLPTLTDLAGIPPTGKKPLDGRSLKPLLLGKAAWPDRLIFSLQGNQVSVRSQQYRLDAGGRLFDMQADPGQEKDISGDRPEVTDKLRQAVANWRKEVLPAGGDDRPFTVGYSKTTQLPARDGVPGGGIRRSSVHPNSSFFTNWTSKEDWITWDVEVAQTAAYDARLYFTCPREDTGSTIELSFNGARVQSKVEQANDPPLVGAEFDRVPRIESYVKDFKPMPAGVIRLAKGRGKLTLRATEIPGKQVADVRYLTLTVRQ